MTGTDRVRPGIGLTGLLPAAAPASSVPWQPAAHTSAALDDVATLLGRGPFALLTGAGLSTDSGIPDYRGPQAVPRTPLTYQEFLADPALRQRYWARNHLGWATMRAATPNAGHHAVAALERAGALTGVITQNVDRLHQTAGAQGVIDLHGRFDRIVCLGCSALFARAYLGTLLEALNPGFVAAVQARGAVEPAPDADAALTDEALIAGFVVAPCPLCGGLLKPDFVFFGENVPKPRVARAFALLDAASALVVAGSSLTVMSGLRFVRHAAKAGQPIVILNRGSTRGDPLATVTLDVGVSESLTFLADRLDGRFA